MASSYTVSREMIEIGKSKSKRIEKVTVAWTAHTDGTFTDTSAIELKGYCLKVTTNPGSTAPTANYDITIKDSDDGTDLDAFATLLNNRHTTATEQVYPLISGAAIPIFLCGNYIISIANNAVNAATGTINFYLTDDL